MQEFLYLLVLLVLKLIDLCSQGVRVPEDDAADSESDDVEFLDIDRMDTRLTPQGSDP